MTIDFQSILDYEVRASRWARHFSHPLFIRFFRWYFRRKAMRKHQRYARSRVREQLHLD